MENKEVKVFDWEKLAIYISVIIAFVTGITYLSDIKERVRALEVEVVNLKVGELIKIKTCENNDKK